MIAECSRCGQIHDLTWGCPPPADKQQPLETPAAVEITTVEKPPVGVAPRWLVSTERAQEIAAAIHRYAESRQAYPEEWLDELRSLNRYFQSLQDD